MSAEFVGITRWTAEWLVESDGVGEIETAEEEG
jgi:hypothetical protein